MLTAYPHRALIALLLVALAFLAGCGEEPRPAPEPPRVVTIVQDDAELLHQRPERIAATLDELRELGADWIRITAGWDVVEPARGTFSWDALDQAVRMARERGFALNIDI